MAATPTKHGPSLFDLSEELRAVLAEMADWAEAHDGDVSEFPMDRMEKLEGDVKAKVLKCARMVKEENALAKSIAEVEKGLKARRTAHAAHVERFKAYIASCLPANAKYEDEVTAVSWKNNPPAVEVLVEAKILPARYAKRADPEADLTALKADMVPFQVPVLDAEKKPVLDGDGKPVLRTELQVRWPIPTGEKKQIPGEDGEMVEADVTEDKVIARMVQGRSLMIR